MSEGIRGRRTSIVFVLMLAVLVASASAVPGLAEATQRYRYPLEGPHNYGNLLVTGFGAKRANGTVHTGQDVIADCGTPTVAAHAGKVRSTGYSKGYGFYVVLHGTGTRFDFVYGHMKGRSRVQAGRKVRRVRAGQRLGSVGSTGSDSGVCHLHFELWKGRWFSGGSRTDPLPHLRVWDQRSGGPLQEEPVPPPGKPYASQLLYRTAD
jgi:murein DD-endopeptidase MepM/ murein hydrolase activator NlpD